MRDKKYKFTDLDLSFTRNPITGDVPLKTDYESVKRSIRNLVMTNKYERLFQPTIFGGITDQLFELAGPFALVETKDRIKQVIQDFEPRAVVQDVRVAIIADTHQMQATIIFRLENDDRIETLSLGLERLR